MSIWNPNTPGAKGQEWLAHQQRQFTMDRPGGALGIVVPAVGTEDIDRVWLWAQALAGNAGEHAWAMDVYPLANAVAGARTISRYYPDADHTKVNVIDQASGTTNLWQAIDEVTVDVDNYIDQGSGGAPYTYAAHFDIPSGEFDDRHVIRVLARYALGSNDVGRHRARPFFNMDGTIYYGSDIYAPQAPAFTLFDSGGGGRGVVNPAPPGFESHPRLLPWYGRDVEAFSGALGAINAVGITDPAGVGSWILYALYLDVEWVPEQRIARGAFSLPSGDDGWIEVDMHHVTDGGNTIDLSPWAKVDGTEYLFVFHRTSNFGSVRVNEINSDGELPDGRVLYHPTLIAPDGLPHGGAISSLGDPADAGTGLILLTDPTADDQAEDSNPYSNLAFFTVDDQTSWGSPTQTANVYDISGGTYGFVRLVVAAVADPPGGDLLVELRQVTSDALLGSGLITADDLVAPITEPQQVEFYLDTPAAGGSAYLKFTSDAASSDASGWTIGLLEGLSGGASNHGTLPGGETEANQVARGVVADVVAVLYTVPDTPADFSVETA